MLGLLQEELLLLLLLLLLHGKDELGRLFEVGAQSIRQRTKPDGRKEVDRVPRVTDVLRREHPLRPGGGAGRQPDSRIVVVGG